MGRCSTTKDRETRMEKAERMQPEQLHDPRVALAVERTLLAWVRTSLAMMGFGFVVAKFGLFLGELAAVHGTPLRPRPELSLWVGGSLIILGVLVNVVAAMRHTRIIAGLVSGKPYQVSPWSFGVIVTLIMAVFGLVLTAYLCFWSH